MKIVMLDELQVSKNLIDELASKLKLFGHDFIACDTKLSRNEKIDRIKDAEIVIIANEILDEELIKIATKLKYISVAFTGIDHISTYIRNTDIIISNTSGYATNATAELTINMMLNVLRNTVKCDWLCRAGLTKDGYVGNELFNKQVGIIGGGKIGQRVSEILKAFNCEILVYDVNVNQELAKFATYVSLEELLIKSDIISIHTPLNETTVSLIDKSAFKLMKNEAILINCARGNIVNSLDLIDALNNNQLRGAGLDVFDIEPPLNTDHLLLNHEKIVVTPHIGFATKESMILRAEMTFENIYQYLDGNVINKQER